MNMASDRPIAERLRGIQRRISGLNARYRAYSYLAQVPLELVAQLDAESNAKRLRSSIHGLFISIKGNIPVANLPWTEGSAIFGDRIAEKDAHIVRKLREGGGVVLGTTTLSELAMYGVENAFEPMGLNPWDVRRTAGGSSTGAAVAAALALADISIGTDSGGSVRNPACHCGCVGFMPSMRAVTMEGIPDHTPTLSNIGIIARSVRRVQAAYEVVAGRAKAAPMSGRLLVPSQLIGEMCDEESLTIFNGALKRMKAAGFELVEREIAGWREGELAAGTVSLSESGQAVARLDLSRASSALKERAVRGQALPQHEVEAARLAMSEFRSNLSVSLKTMEADAVITPTWPFAAPLIHAETATVRGRPTPIDPHRNCFVRAANAAGACAITLPSGMYAAERVPAGIQIMTAAGGDAGLLTLATRMESALDALPEIPVNCSAAS
jgi:Asp-tRNA(Asn)/Glu-tRNA(Gln) amidotransferase A subunit family amidase